MNLTKSIEKDFSHILYFLLFLTLISVVSAVILPAPITKFILVITIICNISITLFISSTRKIKFTVLVLFTSFLLYILMFFIFRKIRDVFPNPELSEEVVGFAKYYNYPVHFDLFLLAIIILIPFMSFFLIKRLRK